MAATNVVTMCRHEPVFVLTSGAQFVTGYLCACSKCGRVAQFGRRPS